jgi:hypothetical protein
MKPNRPTEAYELLPGQTLTLEVRRDPVLWGGLLLSIAAVLVSLLALAVAVHADHTSRPEAATFPTHRVVMHKARVCYTLMGERHCTVRWVHDVKRGQR